MIVTSYRGPPHGECITRCSVSEALFDWPYTIQFSAQFLPNFLKIYLQLCSARACL
ncbi:unnamed protein product, partial [Staurois parvus]